MISRLLGRVLKLQRDGHRNLDSGIPPNRPPKHDGNGQRDQLERQVLQHILAEEIEEGFEHGLAFRSIGEVFFMAEALDFAFL